jgi:hypothetical protein
LRKNRCRHANSPNGDCAQDMRDLLKVLIVLIMVIAGYFIFAPARETTRAPDAGIERMMPAR